ncbi:hypothetical protein [Sphingosinicella sp.]|uniref:hypothetical protein n=1 Tax=Sphingosinicella sp. TaxID=1917971 RepID=UPI0035B09E7C
MRTHDAFLVIDAATLMGAIMNAFYDGYAGLFSTTPSLWRSCARQVRWKVSGYGHADGR